MTTELKLEQERVNVLVSKIKDKTYTTDDLMELMNINKARLERLKIQIDNIESDAKYFNLKMMIACFVLAAAFGYGLYVFCVIKGTL